MTNLEKIKAEIKTLPFTEQELLIKSIKAEWEEDDFELSDEQKVELEKRLSDVRSGKVKLFPVREVIEDLQQL